MAPVEFVEGQQIDVKAVKMTSTHTQLPYEYYSLEFCRPKNGSYIFKSENLGEVLRGDRIGKYKNSKLIITQILLQKIIASKS